MLMPSSGQHNTEDNSGATRWT